jgi:uncharacterized protein (UPF0210 family)
MARKNQPQICIVTVTGVDKVGIIAKLSTAMARANINIVDTPAEVLSNIIADELSIGVINNKTTGVRVIPVPRKKAGDIVHFGGLLGSAPIMKVAKTASPAFIARGGRIPSPIQALRN